MEGLRADQDVPPFPFRGAGFVLGAEVTAMRISFSKSDQEKKIYSGKISLIL